MASVTRAVWVQLVTDIWASITDDLAHRTPLNIRYGIKGNGPLALTASSGQLTCSMRNHAGNSVGSQGAYSPGHANARAGWTFGVPILVSLTDGVATAFSVSSVTRSGSTATATTSTNHGRTTGDWVEIAGAVETDYNGPFQITVTGVATFTYTVFNSPGTPANGTITSTRTHIKFRGKVRSIEPDAGQYREQQVHVTAYDGMRDLAEANVRDVALQVDQGEDDILTSILDAVPADAQPTARSLATGIDTYPYAFDQVGGGRKALSLIQEVASNSRGFMFMKGDGTFVYQSRHGRSITASSYTFSNSMRALAVPATLDNVFNHVLATVHPRSEDAEATTVLYALTGAPPEIQPGASLTIIGNFRDPTNVTDKTLIGGTAVVTPVENTDYDGNSAANGSGSDLSSSLSVALTAWASSAKFVITNNHATTPIFLVNTSGVTLLQCRGKGIYDDGPQTVESESAQPYGDRPITVDLTLQANPNTAQGLADFIRASRESLADQVDSLEFAAYGSNVLMAAAVAGEPGERLTLTEAMTGLASVDAFIQSVELDIFPTWMVARWGLVVSSTDEIFILDDSVSGVLDTSKLGYA